MSTPVMRDYAKSILCEIQHLPVPCVRIQRPSMRKRYDRTLAPVFVIDCCAIFHRDCAHMISSFLARSVGFAVFTWREQAPEHLYPSRETLRILPVWFCLRSAQ